MKLDQVPYRDEGMGSRKVVDEQHVLMMQAALRPGQRVPEHKANSNVHIVVDVNGGNQIRKVMSVRHVLIVGVVLGVG